MRYNSREFRLPPILDRKPSLPELERYASSVGAERGHLIVEDVFGSNRRDARFPCFAFGREGSVSGQKKPLDCPIMLSRQKERR